MERALVEEVGRGPSASGKPPGLPSVSKDARQPIGIDLARGGVQGAVVSLRGSVQFRAHRPLADVDGHAALGLVYDLVDELKSAAGNRLRGVGPRVPGLIENQGGIVRRAVVLNWHDLPRRELLESRCDLLVHMANDCQTAALSEFTSLAARVSIASF